MPEGAIREKHYDRKIARAEQKLGEPLVPASQREQVYRMTPKQLKEYFPVRWEAFVSFLKNRGEEISTETLFAFAQWIHTLNAQDDYIEKHTHDEKGKVLRHYQAEAFKDMRMYLELGYRKGYMVLPGGAGKTVIFAEFIKATGLRTLVVTPFQDLVKQTQKEIQRFSGKEVGMIYAGKKDYGTPITVTTYQSFLAGVKSGKINPKDYDCLIIDEADTAMTQKAKAAIGQFSRALTLGFTATPKRSEEQHIADIYENEIHAITVNEAVQLGAMAPAHVVPVHTHCDASNIRIKANGDYDEDDKERALNVKKRNLTFARLYKEQHFAQKAIAFVPGVKTALAFAEELIEVGVPADKIGVVTYKTPPKERDKIIQDFHAGRIWALSTVRALGRGFNDEEVSVIFRMNPTLSIPQVAQEGMRGARVPQKEYEAREEKLDNKQPGRRKWDKVEIVYEAQDDYDDLRKTPLSYMTVLQGAALYPETSPAEHESFRYPPVKHPDISIEGIEITYDAQIAFRMHEEMERKKYVPAPDGWMPLSEIAKLFGMSELVARMRLKKGLLQQNVVKEKFINPKTRRLTDYYDNTDNKLFTLLASEKELLKKGWRLTTDVAKDFLPVASNTDALLDYYRRIEWEHPEWVIKRIDESGTYKQYFSPQLMEAVFKVGEGEPPNDWFQDPALADDEVRLPIRNRSALDVYGRKVPDFLRKHPEYIRWYKTKDGLRRFFHPIVAGVWNWDETDPYYNRRFPVVPEKGWTMLIGWTYTDMTSDEKTSIRIFLNKKGVNREYVPTEVGIAIKKRLGKIGASKTENGSKEVAPRHELQNLSREELLRRGWKDASHILETLGWDTGDPGMVASQFRLYESMHPESVLRRYEDDLYVEYLSPQLVESYFDIREGDPLPDWFENPGTFEGNLAEHPIPSNTAMDEHGIQTPLFFLAGPESMIRWYYRPGDKYPRKFFDPLVAKIWNNDTVDKTGEYTYTKPLLGFVRLAPFYEAAGDNRNNFIERWLTKQERISIRLFYSQEKQFHNEEYIPDIVAVLLRKRIADLDKILAKRLKKEAEKFDPRTAPREELLKRGYRPTLEVMRELGLVVEPEVFVIWFEQCEWEHPDWVVKRIENGVYVEYLSKKMMDAAFKIYDGKPPEGWFEAFAYEPESMPYNFPRKDERRGYMPDFGKNTPKFLKEHPQYVRWYRTEHGLAQYMHPRVKEVWDADTHNVEYYKKYPIAPEGWKDLDEVARHVGYDWGETLVKKIMTLEERSAVREFRRTENDEGTFHIPNFVAELITKRLGK